MVQTRPVDEESALPIFTIYRNPLDYPNKWVVRRMWITTAGLVPDKHADTADTLEAVRLFVPPGLHWIQPDPEDDPVIVEMWI